MAQLEQERDDEGLRQRWAALARVTHHKILQPLFAEFRIGKAKKALNKKAKDALLESEFKTYAGQVLTRAAWTGIILPGWEVELSPLPGIKRLEDKLIFHPPGRQMSPPFQIKSSETMAHEVNLQRACAQDPDKWDEFCRMEQNIQLADLSQETLQSHGMLPDVTSSDLDEFWPASRPAAVAKALDLATEEITADDITEYLTGFCKEWEHLIGPGCSGFARDGNRLDGNRFDVYMVPPISSHCDKRGQFVKGLNLMRAEGRKLLNLPAPADVTNSAEQGGTGTPAVGPAVEGAGHQPDRPETNNVVPQAVSEDQDEEELQLEDVFAGIREDLWPPYHNKTLDELRSMFIDLYAAGPGRNHATLIGAVSKWRKAKGLPSTNKDVYIHLLSFFGLTEDQVRVVEGRNDRGRIPIQFLWSKDGKEQKLNFKNFLLKAAPMLLAQAPELPAVSKGAAPIDLESCGDSYSSQHSLLLNHKSDMLDPSIQDCYQQLATTEYTETATASLDRFFKLHQRLEHKVEQRIGLLGLNNLGKTTAFDKLAGAMLVSPEDYVRLNAVPRDEGVLTKPERDALAFIEARDIAQLETGVATLKRAAVAFGYTVADAKTKPWRGVLPEVDPLPNENGSICSVQREHLWKYLETPSDRSSLSPSEEPKSYILNAGNRNRVTTEGITEIVYDIRFSISRYNHSRKRMTERAFQYVEQIRRAAARKPRNRNNPYFDGFQNDARDISSDDELKGLKRFYHAVVDPDFAVPKDWKQTKLDFCPEYLETLPESEEDIRLCDAAEELARKPVRFLESRGQHRDREHASVRAANLDTFVDGASEQEYRRRTILAERTLVYMPTLLCADGHRFADNAGLNDSNPEHIYKNFLLYELPPAEGGADVLLGLTGKDIDGDQRLLETIVNFKALAAKRKGDKQIIIARLNEKDDLAQSPCMLYNTNGLNTLKAEFLGSFAGFFRALEDKYDRVLDDDSEEDPDPTSWLECISTIPLLNLRPVLQAALLVHPDWKPPDLTPQQAGSDTSRSTRSDVENSTGVLQLMGALEHELSKKRYRHLLLVEQEVREARFALETGFLQGETEATMKGLVKALQEMAEDAMPDSEPTSATFRAAVAAQTTRLLNAVFRLDDDDPDDAIAASMKHLRRLQDQQRHSLTKVQGLIDSEGINKSKRGLTIVMKKGSKTVKLSRDSKVRLEEALMQWDEEHDANEEQASLTNAAQTSSETLLKAVVEAVQTALGDVKIWATNQMRDRLVTTIRRLPGDQESIRRLLQHMAEYYVQNVADFVPTLGHITRIRDDFLRKLAGKAYTTARVETYNQDIPRAASATQLIQRLTDGICPLVAAARRQWHDDALAELTKHLDGATDELTKLLANILPKFYMWANHSIKQNLKKSGPVTSSINNLLIAAEQMEGKVESVRKNLPSNRIPHLGIDDIERVLGDDGDELDAMGNLVEPFWRRIEQCGEPLMSEMRRQAALSYCVDALGGLASEGLKDMSDVTAVLENTTNISTNCLLAGDASAQLLQYVESLSRQQDGDAEQQISPKGAQLALADARAFLGGPSSAAASLLVTAYRLSPDAETANEESRALEEMMLRAVKTTSGINPRADAPYDPVSPLLALLAWCKVTASNILLPSALGGSADSFLMLHSSRNPKTAFVMSMLCKSPGSAGTSSGASSSTAWAVKFLPVIIQSSQLDRTLGKRPMIDGNGQEPEAQRIRSGAEQDTLEDLPSPSAAHEVVGSAREAQGASSPCTSEHGDQEHGEPDQVGMELGMELVRHGSPADTGDRPIFRSLVLCLEYWRVLWSTSRERFYWLYDRQGTSALRTWEPDSYQDLQTRNANAPKSFFEQDFHEVRQNHAAFVEWVSYYLPCYKKYYRGDDFHQVTSFGAFTADGVSGGNMPMIGNRYFSEYSAILARNLVENCVQQADCCRGRQLQRNAPANYALEQVLQPACEKLHGVGEPEHGATTISVATIFGKQLHIASMGDCGILVLRPNKTRRVAYKCIYYSQPTYFPGGDPTNPTPAQLRYISTDETRRNYRLTQPSDPSCARAVHTKVVDLEHGDIVIGGSDGLFDNLGSNRQQAQTLIEALANRSEDSGNVRILGQRLYHYCVNRMHNAGGKPDDLTLWVSRVSTRVTDNLPARPEAGRGWVTTYKTTPMHEQPLQNMQSLTLQREGKSLQGTYCWTKFKYV